MRCFGSSPCIYLTNSCLRNSLVGSSDPQSRSESVVIHDFVFPSEKCKRHSNDLANITEANQSEVNVILTSKQMCVLVLGELAYA